MENLKKRKNIRFVKNYRKQVSKPIFVSQEIFNENFVAIH